MQRHHPGRDDVYRALVSLMGVLSIATAIVHAYPWALMYGILGLGAYSGWKQGL